MHPKNVFFGGGAFNTAPLCTSRPQKYPDEVGGNIPSNVPEMYPVPGKMGENGGKWGEMGGKGGNEGEMGRNGGKWGKMRGGMGCYGGRWGQITKSVGLGWTGLVSPFSPIFPHFSLGAFTNAPPPPALLPIKTMFFGLFSPKIPHFSIEHPKFSHTFPHFPPFFLNQPISDKCTVTFRKRVFLRPAHLPRHKRNSTNGTPENPGINPQTQTLRNGWISILDSAVTALVAAPT